MNKKHVLHAHILVHLAYLPITCLLVTLVLFSVEYSLKRQTALCNKALVMTVPRHTAHATLYDFSVRQHLFPLSFAHIGGYRTGPNSVLWRVSSTTGFHKVMQQRVYQSWNHNIDEVKQRLLNLCYVP